MFDVFKAKLDNIALKSDIARQIEPNKLWNTKILILVHLFLRQLVVWLAVSLLCLLLSFSYGGLLQLLDLFLHNFLLRLIDSKLLLFFQQLIPRLAYFLLNLQISHSNLHDQYEDKGDR